MNSPRHILRMIVTELSKGIKLYLLVGGKGTRLASISNGIPKPLMNIHGKPFIQRVIENLSGFDITLVCSDLNYEHFKDLGVEVFNEGEPSGTAGFLRKVDLPESFYVMNGDTFYSGDLNLDTDTSTVFVAEELVASDVGYIEGKDGKVERFVEKNPGASGKKMINMGIYKIYSDDIVVPDKLPLSMEYDIMPMMPLSYKVLESDRFDIGTPERLERFKLWCV